MPDLKPCPFCGGEVRRKFDGSYWSVECEECPSTEGVIRRAEVFGKDESQVIAAWNRRSE